MSEATEKIIEEEALEVRTDIEAGWQMKRRKEIIADRDELIAFYEAQIKAVKEDADYKLGFIDRALYAFFMTKQHTKTKTQEYIKLPLGKLMMKKQNPEYKRDDKAVIEWLKANNGNQYIKTKEELDWSSLKSDTTVVNGQLANADGEFIPGVEVIEREAKFCVE